MRSTAFTFLFLLILLPLSCAAGGGVWLLHIVFEHNHEVDSGYVFADHRAMDYERIFLRDSSEKLDFHTAFALHFGNWESLNVYGQITDNRKLAAQAVFPMQPFSVVDSTLRQIAPSAMQHVRLLEVMEKSDYMIEVHNLPELKDSLWVGGSHQLHKPLGDEVGCRLEVYDFGDADESLVGKIHTYAYYYSRTDPLQDNEIRIMEELLATFSRNRIVVVELCGC